MQLFKRTPEEAFQNIESFDYKTHYIENLVNISSEYKGFRIAYIDENTHSKNGTLLFIHGQIVITDKLEGLRFRLPKDI